MEKRVNNNKTMNSWVIMGFLSGGEHNAGHTSELGGERQG
jgi:hypothetical protein